MFRWVLLALGLIGCGTGAPDFSLIVPDGTVELELGRTSEILVSLERVDDYDQSVVVTASGLRAGITAGALSLRPDQDSGALLLAVEGSAPLGPIDGAMVIGVSGDLERSAAVSLTVVTP